MEYLSILSNRLDEWGASFSGFSCLEDVENTPCGFENAVTVGIRLSKAIVEEISNHPTYTYFHHYRTVNALLDQICLKGMLAIQEEGYEAFAVPASQTVNDVSDEFSGVFSHKTAAIRAGLGWIGKSGLFISKDYGPRVRLGTILTDMPLKAQNVKNQLTDLVTEGCGSCKVCVKSCPAMAITGNGWYYGCERNHLVDARACSQYMNVKFKHIGRGSVCGICMKVCPYGK